MERSLFTKIIDRDIPATIEYEDDSVIAIRDIAPVAPVHILIIPKKPLLNVNSVNPEDHALLGHIFHVAQQMATKFNITDSGYRVITNVNDDGGQSVSHLHFHLLGGQALGYMTSHRVHNTFWRDLAVLLVAAIVLAYGYNELNPKHIKWVRPVYTTDTLATSTIMMPDSLTHKSGAGNAVTNASDAMTHTVDALKDSIKRSANSTTRNAVDTVKALPSAPCYVAQAGVIKEISYDQFVMFLKMPCVALIDARIPESYAKGHVQNAINIDGTQAESPDVIPLLAAFPHDKIIVIYCDGGECELSHRVADVLKNFGYGPIYIYTGGWAEWSKKK